MYYEGSPDSSFARRGAIRYRKGEGVKIKSIVRLPRGARNSHSMDATIGHRWLVTLAAVEDPYGGSIQTDPYWIDPVEGPYRDRSVKS